MPICFVLLLTVTQAHAQADSITPAQVNPCLRNKDWPAAWEDAFMDRARYVVEQTASAGRYGNTFFENEKRSYAMAMLSLLGGHDEPALKFLQENDNPGHWSTHTEGIDFYACFTLKHQVRKYFYFGDRLDPAYKARMDRGAKTWTERDPLNRPHHAFEGKTGWGPDAKNSWVDVRNTDNLKLMRDTSVYLFAEAAGNEQTRLLYKEKLKAFIVSLYFVGQGEWDSENYLGHSIAPLLNLYDFAIDKEVKRLAKAGLDFMSASLALKYYRGNYNGPSRRDYNHPYPFGGSAAFVGWLWFGDAPTPPDKQHIEPDAIHVITSAYRPPAAVVELARKNFDKPVELFAGKGKWEAWRDLNTDRPSYRETHYFGDGYQFGTLARGTQRPDINGFKILVEHPERGADTLVAGPISDPTKLGSSQYNDELLAPHSAVGHHANFAVCLTQQSDHPYLWLIPADAKIEQKGSATFIATASHTIAIWPINASHPVADDALTRTARVKEKTHKKTGEVTVSPRWPHVTILRSERSGPGVYGFAIEVYAGDRPGAFVEAARQRAPETGERAVRGAVAMTAVSGKRVRLQWGDTLDAIGVWRDGKKREWDSETNKALFHTIDGDLITLPWQGDGVLRVNAGGRSFTCRVDRDGTVRLKE
ncbi:MAG: hypothetical protein ACE37H_01390 [Phycisphaeraceae bacterium]